MDFRLEDRILEVCRERLAAEPDVTPQEVADALYGATAFYYVRMVKEVLEDLVRQGTLRKTVMGTYRLP
jgi:hypothetical protein